MALVVDPAFAAAITLVPVAATNLWQAIDGRLFMTVVRRFWTFLVTLMLGVVVGSQILVALPAQTAAMVIGIAVVVLGPIPLIAHRLAISPRQESKLNPLIGAAVGVLGGTTVIFSPVLVYFAMLRLDKNLFVATASIGAICSMLPLYLGLGLANTLTWDATRFSTTLLVPTLAGFILGRALRSAVSQRAFRLILTFSLVLLGVGLIAKGVA